MTSMSKCILYNCDSLCQDDCEKCVMFGKVDKTTMYKFAHIHGFYAVCCPACKRVKYKVYQKDMLQGDCAHCDKRIGEE